MDPRHLAALLVAFLTISAGAVILTDPGFPGSDSPSPDQQYPHGTGPDHINFSTLNSDSENVSHTPRDYWDSYAIVYTAPAERPLVEGNYHINSTSGEIVSDLWDGAKDYRKGETYAFVQPAESIPNEHRREEFESDDSFVHDNATNAYYRYDQHYGQVAPTNLGRHTNILEPYTWEAVNTTTHHGVPIIVYQATGKRTDNSQIPPASGTLRIGVEDGVVYAFDVTVDQGEETYQYTYDVGPTAFPDLDWVEKAREVAAENPAPDK